MYVGLDVNVDVDVCVCVCGQFGLGIQSVIGMGRWESIRV